MSDPYAVLGLPADATQDEVASAYRDLAKRHHPDLAPADGDRMREVNRAYDSIVRNARGAEAQPGPSPAAATSTRGRQQPRPGGWLSATVRRQLGSELLESLKPLEDVLLIADASSWDSPSIRLVATDRRLLWLRDDAPVARVRSMPYSLLEDVELRLSRRGRQAELRVKPRESRRLSFAEMAPETVQAILRVVRPRIASVPRAVG